MPDKIHTENGPAVPSRNNPQVSRDYIISMQKTLPAMRAGHDRENPVEIYILYVPDRLIHDASQIEQYFDYLTTLTLPGIEELANAIADDFSNEIIPRWISVKVSVMNNGDRREVRVEDKQPLWENVSLLRSAL